MAVSLQVTRVINPTAGCDYFPPGLQLPPQSLRGLLPISLLGEQRHDGCEQFAKDCYPTTSRLRFEPGPSAPESSTLTTRLPSVVLETLTPPPHCSFRLSRLGLESLLYRPVKTDLVMCYKTLHNLIDVDCVNFFSAPHFLKPEQML